MSELAHRPFPVTTTRIGRTDLGSGTVAADDEAIMVVLQAPAEERSIRIACAAVDEITIEENEVVVRLLDGMRLVLAGDDAAELRMALVEHCRAIPEVTRALRALGSRRGHGSARASGPAEQKIFFAPLLDARREAVGATRPEQTLAAFDSTQLERAIGQAIQVFATGRYGENPPARRALEAELTDLSEPLINALDRLRQKADDARGAVDDLRLWRAWSTQLRATFETADRVWLSLDAALDATPWHS